ncbi:MAG: glutamate mutase L [Caldilineaceae bacterium]|nr:glutamate mutase L [Caldilineaceae bacterium]
MTEKSNATGADPRKADHWTSQDQPGAEPAASVRKRRVMVGAIGKCVHNLGVENFSDWMKDRGEGYFPVKLGPAVPIDEVISKVREARPEIVGVSMRLGDLHVDKLISEFIEKATLYGLHPKESGIRFAFSGLRPAANLVRAMTDIPLEEDRFTREEERHYDFDDVRAEYAEIPHFKEFFDLVADDFITMEELEEFAAGPTESIEAVAEPWSDFLVKRLKQVRERENRPAIRAHIGIAAPTIEPTVEGIIKLAEAEAFEIVSLAPDQTSQELLAKFIRGEEDPSGYLAGQGGAPIRTIEDLRRLKEASQRGNFPLTRIYTGTDELVELAKLYEAHLNMAFPAVPIFFYNQIDGRGPISIRDSFEEHYATIRWWADRGKPLEINDPHQWGLRYASDDMQATDHVLVAVIALKLGIKHYVMQQMFELPPAISALDDLAKMKGAVELIEPLTRHFDFRVLKQTRSGLPSFPPNLNQAKGHLAFGIYTQLYMEPDILHVVTHSEAHHEASADDIIESCEIVKQVCWDFAKGGVPNIWADPVLGKRKLELQQGAMYNLLHLAILGGYEGECTVENFADYAQLPAEGDGGRNFETMLLSLVDDNNYASGECGMISPDTLDLALQVGLFQGPHITVVDRRYELSGACRTHVVDGMCRCYEWNGIPVRDEFHRVDLMREHFPWYFDKSITRTDDSQVAYGEDSTEDHIDEAAVDRYRKEVGITGHIRDRVLVADFGSTYTKIGIFDPKDESFSLNYVPTTVDDIRVGLANGMDVLDQCQHDAGNGEIAYDWAPLKTAMDDFAVRLPCSSAKGGLKVVTVALSKAESAFAAELAALTAGAKLVGTYDGKLSPAQARAIFVDDQPEIVLIAGGTDEGGDTQNQIHNATLLAENAKYATYTDYGIPFIYAGSQDALPQIERIFKANNIDYRMSPNVMPEINDFRIETVNEAIRELFQTVIIRGKGFDVVEEYMDAPFIPTPRACFRGIQLLAHGYGNEEGLGNLLALDIGGATTDFYSMVRDNPLYLYPGDDRKKSVKRTILKTPNTPLSYRRVEGKYGLSYNAENLKELEQFKNGSLRGRLSDFLAQRFPAYRPGKDQLGQFVYRGDRLEINLDKYLSFISANPHNNAIGQVESAARAYLAREIMAVATEKHVGHVQETDTYFLQYGVNFFNQSTKIILIGGTIYHKCRYQEPGYLDDLSLIASGVQYDPAASHVLRPDGPVLMDASYLVSILGGLYGRLEPERALRVMKRKLLPLETAGVSAKPIAQFA